jgi:hypothetical protein
MKVFSTVILLSLALTSAYSYVCKSYSCLTIPENAQLTGEDAKNPFCSHIVAASSDLQVSFENCTDENQYCSANSASDPTSICSDTFSNRFPGDTCDAGFQCKSGTCSGGACTGLDNGVDCDMVSNICNVGFFCGPMRKCEAILKLDDDCTGNHYGCPFFSLCHSNNGKQMCKRMFSLDDATVVEIDDHLLCKSVYVGQENGVYKCTPGPTLSGERKRSQAGDTCVYKRVMGSTTFTEEVTSFCGFN